MIILEKPFVSDFLIDTVIKHKYPVLDNAMVREHNQSNLINIIPEKEAGEYLRNNEFPFLYTNSENSVQWIINNLNGHHLAEQINLFKDKVKFRDQIKNLYPDFYYREIQLSELDLLDIRTIPRPFVIKPSVGFFSIAVKIVSGNDDWEVVKQHIYSEIKKFERSYPQQVLSTTKLIIEEYVQGDEYAFDAYFDSDGQPVILNILKHLYSSDSDTRDRVYISSKKTIENNIKNFERFLIYIGESAGLKNFPLHTEVRINKNGEVIPIEINPLRFGGWCTTADATYFAYGINSYQYYLENKKPDWDNIFRNKADYYYTVIVLDNSTGIASDKINEFDYDKLLSHFEKPLELRKTDYKNFHVFGFLFTETRKDNFAELEYILHSDLTEFIK